MKLLTFPLRYLPKSLSKKDKKKQIKMLLMSKKLYKKKTILHAINYHLTNLKHQTT
jgi:hypothetical protein